MTECKICYKEFKSIECQSICLKCQRKILKSLGVELSDNFNVINKEHNELVTFVYWVSEMGGYIDYLLHALENHTHGTKTVNTVDIE